MDMREIIADIFNSAKQHTTIFSDFHITENPEHIEIFIENNILELISLKIIQKKHFDYILHLCNSYNNDKRESFVWFLYYINVDNSPHIKELIKDEIAIELIEALDGVNDEYEMKEQANDN